MIKMTENKENLISIDEFLKIKIRIGKIIEVEPIENSDKLYRLVIDVKQRKIQCVAGLKDYYKVDDLKNRLVPVIINLKPAKIRGVLSEGMILAAESGNSVKILVPDGEINIGSKIR